MEPAASAKTPSLAWKWILEKLLDIPNFGSPFFDGIISNHISDIEEPHCEPLLKRVALRFLKERIDRNQIDSSAIPLLKAITGKDLHSRSTGLSIKQRFDKELVLRVQTEVVLSVLRKDLDEGEKDWALYESELERVFEEAEEDNRLLDRKWELRALLEPKNQTKDIVTAYFRKFSLNKLRLDLRSLIVEKRETLDTMFLDQLSRAFLDANGKPFSEDLGGVEKSTNVEANEKQDNVGTVNVESLQQLGLGKKRRREHLSTQNASGDDESEEADEGLAGMKKSRKSSGTPIVSPAKTLLRQCVSEPAVRPSGPQLDCLPATKEVESTKPRVEPLSGSSNLGQDLMSSSAVAHESTSMEEGTVPVREPSHTDHYVISDSETQVAQKLSTDGKVRLNEKDNGDNHNKREARSFSENESDRGHPQGIVETEFVKETIILQRGRRILGDRRKEASTGSPDVKQEDNERFVTKEFKTLDSEDVCEVDFLGVGCDDHEEVCHMCGKHGKLLRCEGCPMSLHFDCIKALGLRLPKSEEWRCPNCLLLKAEREAAEAEKVAVAAKDKLQVFKMESKKMKNSPLRSSRQDNGIKQSSLRRSSLQSEENDSVLKPNQESYEDSNLEYTEGQHFNSTPSPASSEAYLRRGRCKIPGLRRTPLPWTRAEEEVLKRGVCFSSNGRWGANRWSNILKFGQGIFDLSRTSVDVKDKWRNLAKRANAS